MSIPFCSGKSNYSYLGDSVHVSYFTIKHIFSTTLYANYVASCVFLGAKMYFMQFQDNRSFCHFVKSFVSRRGLSEFLN